MEPPSCPSLSSQLIAPQVIHSSAFGFIDLSVVNHEKQKLSVPNGSSIWVESVAFWVCESWCAGQEREGARCAAPPQRARRGATGPTL